MEGMSRICSLGMIELIFRTSHSEETTRLGGYRLSESWCILLEPIGAILHLHPTSYMYLYPIRNQLPCQIGCRVLG
jgi:hypothetical protein